MSLDVWIGDWDQPGSVLAASFEPEAYYWFIYPLLESLHESHGKYIDLYGGCEFKPHELPLFRKLLDGAEALVEAQPENFQVCVGTQVQLVKRKLFVGVNRDSYLKFIASLRSAADRCSDSGKSLRFYGD